MRKSIFLISHRATFSLILPSPWNHGTSPGYNRSWVLMVQQSMTSLNSQAAIADYKGKQSLVLGKGPGFLVLSPRDQMETSYVYCFAVLQCFGEVVLFISFRWNIMETILMVSSCFIRFRTNHQQCWVNWLNSPSS